MTWNKKTLVLTVLLLTGMVSADTFKNKETGAAFDGFATQKTIGGQTRVFNAKTSSFENVVLDEYDVTRNTKGRSDRAIVVQITSPETLLSEKISMQIAKGIADASNKGPQVIIVQIDSPGGRAEYMKNVASAILETKNCPVVAYISGGETGGAFGSAAVVAMACEKVFIAKNAVLGSVGPAPSNLDEKAYSDYLKTYTPTSVSGPYMISFLKTVAQQRNRPELLVRGLLDKFVSIVEVVNASGQRQFIQRDDLQPTQTIVRTLCEGLTQPSGDTSAALKPSDLSGAVLTLTADDAVKLGLADSLAGDIKDIPAALEVPDVQLGSLPGIDKLIKQFNAGRRNISKSLSQIQYLEESSKKLETQFETLDQQLVTSTRTRETTSGYHVYSSRRTFPSDWTQYYDPGYRYSNQQRTNQQSTKAQRYNPNRSTVITEEPAVNITVVQQRLAQSLQLLIAEYRRVINLAKRWPGGLPPEVTRAMLEENAASAQQELTRLFQYQPISQQNTRTEYQQTGRRQMR